MKNIQGKVSIFLCDKLLMKIKTKKKKMKIIIKQNTFKFKINNFINLKIIDRKIVGALHICKFYNICLQKQFSNSRFNKFFQNNIKKKYINLKYRFHQFNVDKS